MGKRHAAAEGLVVVPDVRVRVPQGHADRHHRRPQLFGCHQIADPLPGGVIAALIAGLDDEVTSSGQLDDPGPALQVACKAAADQQVDVAFQRPQRDFVLDSVRRLDQDGVGLGVGQAAVVAGSLVAGQLCGAGGGSPSADIFVVKYGL